MMTFRTGSRIPKLRPFALKCRATSEKTPTPRRSNRGYHNALRQLDPVAPGVWAYFIR
jgi:hypothetical protein